MKRLLLLTVMFAAVLQINAQITGNVNWEQWASTMSFGEIATATDPDVTITLTELSSPPGFGDNYSSRFSGYIIPTTTGEHTFWIRSDDGSEFWLSKDASPDELERICYSPGYSSSWTSYEEQKSEKVSLVAGESYYFMALHKEGTGGDFVTVAWDQPGEPEGTRNIIGSSNISQTPNDDITLKNVLTFEFSNLANQAFYTIDRDNLTIDVDVANGTDLTSLVADFVISNGATPSFASGSAQDYSSPVTLTVTAADNSTADYTITVTELPLQTGNEITRFYLDPLEQDAIIDNTANTITYWYFDGYTKDQTVTLETSLYASASMNNGTVITVTDPPESLTVTAQDGSERTYAFIAEPVTGIKGFRDDFSTADYVGNWNDNNGYDFTWDEPNEQLQLQMTPQGYRDTRFNFPDSLNLYGYTYLRMRLKTNKLIYSNGVQFGFADADGNGIRDWRTNIETKILETDNFVELILDFTSKFNNYDHVELGNIQQLYFHVDRNATGTDALVHMDDFRVGVDAVANKAPSLDQPQSPDWTYITGGAQEVILTGIADGNPEREETMTITAVSSDQGVVKDEDISVLYDGTSETATLSYTGTARGFATIKVYVQDDRGTAYSDEADTDSVTFVAQFRDNSPGVNNIATFDTPIVPDYYLGTGQNIIIIPNVDDGDEDEDQEIIFTLDNLNEDVIRIDSLVYHTGDRMALIYFTELGVGATATLQLSCQDKVNLDAGGDEIFTMPIVVQPSVIDNPGVNYGATQTQQWQPVPYNTSVVWREGYPAVFPAAEIRDDCKDDLFWGKMWGYIIPPETGNYQFIPETEGEGIGNFYLSTDHLPENLPASADNWTAMNGTPSSVMTLQKSKPYYFEAYHKEIINDYKLIINWTGPGFAQQILSPPSVVFALDLEKPTTPENFRVSAKGTNEVILRWEPSTDNNRIEGYYLLLNGYLFGDSLFTGTEASITGLKAETMYQASILAVDEFFNSSLPAQPVSFTTYGEDDTPPAAPTNVVVAATTIYSATIEWDAATDNETEVFGYYIYQDGSDSPLNSLPVQELSYHVTGLESSTGYTFNVTAVDAGRNESAQSADATGTTMAFDWQNKEEEEMIGQVDVTLHPMTRATGFTVETGYGLGSMLVSNKVSFSCFESEYIKDFALSDDLAKVQKSSSGVTVYAETDDPYDGEKSLKLTVSSGGKFSNRASIAMSPQYTYLVKFAAKKDANYTPDFISMEVLKKTGGNVTAYEGMVSGLTTDWQVFEVEFQGITNAMNEWFIDWEFSAAGDVYFDNVEMHIKDFYDPDSKFTTIGIDIMKDLDIAGLRWGAITANSQTLHNSSGPYQTNTMTYADFVYLSKMLGGYALITTGVYDGAYDDNGTIRLNEDNATDFFSDKTTFTHFMEYLGGDASTDWGKKRIAEGYTENLIDGLNTLVIELGNEVWGSFSHDAYSFGSDYPYYLEWGNDVAGNYIKQSPYYDPDKVVVSISGRSPDQSFGINEQVYESPNDQIDWISLSGYMGGNLNYEAGVDPGESELDYHKNGYQNFNSKINGLEENWKAMLRATQRIWPVFYYEGNMTTPDYHGTLAQAITFGDYYATAQEHGVAMPNVFSFSGTGQWRIIDEMPSLNKRPLYHVTRLFNRTSRGGVVLETELHSSDSLYDASGNRIDMPSIGAHAYASGEAYSVVLFSRSMEDPYHVKVNLPDDIGSIANGKMYTLKGESYKSMNVSLDSVDVNVTDGMIVTVPKHSMVVITFTADDKGLTAPLGYAEIDRIESLSIEAENNDTEIDERFKTIEVTSTITPDDVFLKELKWEVLDDPDNIVKLIPYGDYARVKGQGTGNGTVTLRASTLDGSGLSDEITFTVTNQGLGVEGTLAGLGVRVYPNPADDRLFVDLPAEKAEVTLMNLQGSVLLQKQLFSGSSQIDLSMLKQGMYLIRVETAEGTTTERFIKQ